MPFRKSKKNNARSVVLVPLASQFQDTSGILPPQSPAPQNTLDILNNARTLSQPPAMQPIRTFGGNRLNRSGIHESTQYTTPVQSSSQGSTVTVGGGINAHNLRGDENGRSYVGVDNGHSGNVRLGESGASTHSRSSKLANAGTPNDIGIQAQAKSNIYIIPALRSAETKKYIIPAHREKLQDCVSSHPQSTSSRSSTVNAGGLRSSLGTVTSLREARRDNGRTFPAGGAVPGGLGNVRSSGGWSTIPPSVLLSNGQPSQRLSTRDLVQSIRYRQLSLPSENSLERTVTSRSQSDLSDIAKAGGVDTDADSGNVWYGVEDSHSGNVQRGFVGNYTVHPQLQSSSTFDTAQSRSDDLKQCATRRTG